MENSINSGVDPAFGLLRGYSKTLRQYWIVSLSIGLLFAWLLSFPLQGPLLAILAQSNGLSPLPLIFCFLGGHLIGLVAGGIVAYVFRNYLIWLSSGAVICSILSITISSTPSIIWPVFLGLMGLFSGPVIICWTASFSSSVPPAQRGRTFAIGAFCANLVLYLVILINPFVDIHALLIAIGILPLAVPFLLILWRRKPIPLATPDKETPAVPEKRLNLGTYLHFIFAINAVGGLIYSILARISLPPEDFLFAYGLVPYILLLFVAGYIADFSGRRINAFIGAITVGIGFMLVNLISGPMQYIAIQTLIVGGYAFIDVFIWVITADISAKRNAPLFYSAMLGTNIMGILIGLFLGEKIGGLSSGSEVFFISLAGLFVFAAIAFAFRLRETLRHGPDTQSSWSRISLFELSRKAGFTPRETDIAELLIQGASTQEILDKLFITPNTLKSHLRSIYRKARVRNRLEFTLTIVKDSDNSGRSEQPNPLSKPE